MKKKQSFLYSVHIHLALLICCITANAQRAVPVREEPRHKPVFENKYVRVLNVWLPAGDTTLFHIHSTPSLFNFFTDAKLSTQVRTGPWELSTQKAGYNWYKSFENDTLIHRIINVDSVPCHVMDVELLAKYQTDEPTPEMGVLPFDMLYDNDRATAYKITGPSYINKVINNRGPIITELVAGDGIVYHNTSMNETKILEAGMYLYIEPNTEFHFTNKKMDSIYMVLFELK